MRTEDLIRATFEDRSGEAEWQPQLHAAVEAQATRYRRRRAVVVSAAMALLVAIGVTVGTPKTGPAGDRAAGRPKGLIAGGAARWPVRGDLAKDAVFIDEARRAWNLHTGTVFADSRVIFANVVTGGRVAVLIGHDPRGQQKIGAIAWWDKGHSHLLKYAKVEGQVDQITFALREDGDYYVPLVVLADPSADSIEWQVDGSPPRTESLYNGYTFLVPHIRGASSRVSGTIAYGDTAIYTGLLY